KWMNFINIHSIKFILFVGSLLFVFITFNNSNYLFKTDFLDDLNISRIEFIIYSLLFIFVIYIILFLIEKIENEKVFLIILIIVSFFLKFVWIVLIKTEPVSDFKLLLEAANSINLGNNEFIKNSSYFNSWSYQLGFVSYQAVLIYIFGFDIFILKFFNMIFATMTCIIIYLICKKNFNKKVGQSASILYAIYPAGIYMCSVLTNQILATFLFYFALYCSLFYYKKFAFLPIGVFIALANIIRPEGIIIILAVIIFIFFSKYDNSIFQNTLRNYFLKLRIIMLIIVVFFVVTKIFDFFIMYSDVSEYPLKNNEPLYKFVVGLNNNTTGHYSVNDTNHIFSIENKSLRKKELFNIIYLRLSNKHNLFNLFKDKFIIMWSDFDSSILFLDDNIFLTLKTKTILSISEKLFYTIVVLFSLISLAFFHTKNKTYYQSYQVFLLLIIGFIFVYELIEIQTRYRFVVIPSFFILSSVSLNIFVNFLKQNKLQLNK
ncbi:MAG: glycosyltransferase family 39 protein, partial [Clostridiales bacterium]